MKLIDPSVTMIEESNPFKKIEKVGRTCYKSTSEMTEETAKKFYWGLVSRQHTAMVEHATFVFKVNAKVYIYLNMMNYDFINITDCNDRFLVSGNLRALNDSKDLFLLKALYNIDPDLVYTTSAIDITDTENYGIQPIDLFSLEDLTEEEFMAHAYFSFHFITDRGVTHEMVRHRIASFAQESTRYCNYSKDKFGGEITYIKPANYDNWININKFRFIETLKYSESCYLLLLEKGLTPQEARAVLPNALKTEIIMTANAKEWEHFFNLRSRGTTGAPHPDMKVVADMALELYETKKWAILNTK